LCKRSEGYQQIESSLNRIGIVEAVKWDVEQGRPPGNPTEVAVGVFGLRLGPHATIGGVDGILRMPDGVLTAAVVEHRTIVVSSEATGAYHLSQLRVFHNVRQNAVGVAFGAGDAAVG